MISIGIDASNIRSGGGLTHLKEILEHADPVTFDIDKIIVWSSTKTLKCLPESPWLIKETHFLLNRSPIFSFLYQITLLPLRARTAFNCNLLFVPGGTFLGRYKKIVSLSQNMLPFEPEEIDRFESWKSRIRLRMLYHTQRRTFNKSNAVIFLTIYAQRNISVHLSNKNKSTVIPHGINPDFLSEPKLQMDMSAYSKKNPFKLLYVSIITAYKHQWNVSKAVLKLSIEGYPVSLELVGGNTKVSLDKLNMVLDLDVNKAIDYKGMIPYQELSNVYKNADGFIFASSCENMPIILIEAMSAGLPIASSNMGPMPEVLSDSAIYFDPLDVDSIYDRLKLYLDSKSIRSENAIKSYSKSKNFTWKNCSDATFGFLSEIAKTDK